MTPDDAQNPPSDIITRGAPPEFLTLPTLPEGLGTAAIGDTFTFYFPEGPRIMRVVSITEEPDGTRLNLEPVPLTPPG